MATGKALDGKPYAGNPHVRFDEGEVAPAATPRRGSLLYKMDFALGRLLSVVFMSIVLAMNANAVVVNQVANGNNDKGLSDSALWGEDPDPENDYVAVKSSLYVSSTQSKNTFNGKSLTIGVVGGAAPTIYNYSSGSAEARVANITGAGGLILANGVWLTRYGGDTISYLKAEAGGVTVTSPASAPFKFGNYTTRCGGTIDISGKLRGADTSGLIVESVPCTETKFAGYPVILRINGDATDFLGSVVVSNTSSGGAEFRLSGSASYFGGSITIRDGATFHPEITTSVGSLSLEQGATLQMDAGNALTVGSLAIDSGATLSLVAGNTITVNTALAVEGGPVQIALSGAPSEVVSEVTRMALIIMPASSACTEADFSVPNYGSSVYTRPKLVMRMDGDTKTLCAEYYPIVTLTANNNVGRTDYTTASAVTNGSFWSDELAVHDSAHYQVDRINNRTTVLATPYAPDETLAFPGESLRFGQYTVLQLRTGDYTVSNLMFHCGTRATKVRGLDGTGVTLRGSFSVSGQVDFEPRMSGVIKLIGPVTGTSASLMNICGAAAGTSQCRGIVVLDGDNTGYAGKFRVTLDNPPNLTFGSEFMSLRVTNAKSLGGSMSEFAYDALRLDTAGRLEAYDSFTLDEQTRGVFVSGQGRFYVLADKTLTVKEQLTVNGRAYKEGAGTLALGGALRYLDGDGVVTAVPPSDATNRTFYVTGGYVKPLTADALEGLYVVFSNKTSKLPVGLAMDVAPADANLLAKGICNVGSPMPFAWQSDEASPAIRIRLDCSDETPKESYEFAVMTLSDDVADDVFDSIKFTRPDGFDHYGVKTTRTYDAEAHTATLHATLEPRGIVLLLR